VAPVSVRHPIGSVTTLKRAPGYNSSTSSRTTWAAVCRRIFSQKRSWRKHDHSKSSVVRVMWKWGTLRRLQAMPLTQLWV
jgi:hypothetical protein